MAESRWSRTALLWSTVNNGNHRRQRQSRSDHDPDRLSRSGKDDAAESHPDRQSRPARRASSSTTLARSISTPNSSSAWTDNMISLANGCVCCQIRDDLVESVVALLARPESRRIHPARSQWRRRSRRDFRDLQRSQSAGPDQAGQRHLRGGRGSGLRAPRVSPSDGSQAPPGRVCGHADPEQGGASPVPSKSRRSGLGSTSISTVFASSRPITARCPTRFCWVSGVSILLEPASTRTPLSIAAPTRLS